jgi:predicted phage-related endonuclease
MSLTDQQLIDRKKGLFGTDASMLDETSPYNDPYFLYKCKRGEWDDRLDPAIHLELGHELEDYVARKYTEKTGIETRIDDNTTWNGEYLYEGKPFMGAHVDRWCVGTKNSRILECKTAYTRIRWGKNGSGNIPPNYRSQIKHYCLVLGLHEVDVAVLHLPFPPTIEIHSFDFSQIELDDLLTKEYAIWDRIQKGNPPPVGSSATTNEKLRDEFSGSIEDSTVSSEDLDVHLDLIKQVKICKKDQKDYVTAAQNKIIAHMGEYEFLVNGDGDIVATFKPDAKGIRKLLIK